VFAILNSSWLDELFLIEAVHPLSANHPLHRSRHFFLVFHGSSLEAVATDLVVLRTLPTMSAAVGYMVADLRLR
jgi:hypothetical protein